MSAVAGRFWAKVDMTGDCWVWTASRAAGYGQFGITSTHVVRAHRYAYEALVGPIPAGLTIDHLCGNKLCVRPTHLEPVTRVENIRRAWAERKAAA